MSQEICVLNLVSLLAAILIAPIHGITPVKEQNIQWSNFNWALWIKSMVNTTARQSKGKYPKKPVRIESEKWKTSWSAGKCEWPCHKWCYFWIWLLKKWLKFPGPITQIQIQSKHGFLLTLDLKLLHWPKSTLLLRFIYCIKEANCL